MLKKTTVCVLSLCLMFTVVFTPSAALATLGTAVGLGTGAMKKGDFLWLGKINVTLDTLNYDGPIPWVLLDAVHDNTGATGKFFLSRFVLDRRSYAAGVDTKWVHSGLRTWLNGTFATDTSHFTTAEYYALAATTKADSVTFPPYEGDALSGDKLFLLSADEAADTGYFPSATDRYTYYITNQATTRDWHMRTLIWSMGALHTVYSEAATGTLKYGSVSDPLNVRPAFNLDTANVAFIAAALDGKRSGAVGPGALLENNALTGVTQWKATLYKDQLLDFTVSTTDVYATTAGGTVSINYRNAFPGTNDYVSALLTQGSGSGAAVLYYGRLLNVADISLSNGSQNIVIPSGLTAGGDYSLVIINEEYLGGANDSSRYTDYTSYLRYVTLHISRAAVTAANTVTTGDPQTPWLWMAAGLAAAACAVCVARIGKHRVRSGRD